MNQNQRKISIVTLLMLSFFLAGAQSAIVPTGGNAQNETGSISYTVGQIAVQNESSNGGSVSVAEGVQQAYEIQTVGVNNYPQIVLNAKVFPNPTDNQFQLSLNGFEIPQDGMLARLYDGAGRLLQTVTVTDDETLFQIGHHATGTYLLEVVVGGKMVKTFRVVRR